MPRKKKEESPEVVETPAVTARGAVTVVWGRGTREYSKEVHGAEYKTLAEQFAKKFDGKIV